MNGKIARNSLFRLRTDWLAVATAALMTSLPITSGWAQSPSTPTATPAQSHPTGTPAADTKPTALPAAGGTQQPTAAPDRAAAYYHISMAHTYEEMATTYGRPEYATRAIEEYKLALTADPSSSFLNNGLAELYFKTGRIRDAVLAAQDLLKKNPDDLAAHKLLGRIYLRSLGENQSGPAEKVLDLAIGEYQKIVELEPKSIEDRLLLGQLYFWKHDSVKAEDQFKAAQAIDPGSEEVVLNLARLYGESGQLQRAASVLEAVPASERSGRLEYALGMIYDQLKDSKKATAAYRRAVDLDPENTDAQRTLAQSLLNNGDLDEALKQYTDLAAADPQDIQSVIRIAEIQRRQGKYDAALATLDKAQTTAPDSLEIPFNRALCLDALGRYDDAAVTLEKLLEQTSHANGAYTAEEKNNRAIFLERLTNVYSEQNKTPQAISAYNRMIELGGDYAVRGYQGQVDTYRDAHDYKAATVVAEQAVAKFPKNRGLTLMLAGQLADTGKPDEGLKLAQSQITNTPDDRDVYLTQAQIYTRLRKWSDAQIAIEKAEPLSKRSEDQVYLLFMKGTLAERQKHYDEAEKFFREILAKDPDSGMTLNYLGYMLADRGVKLNEALSMLNKAVDLDPQNGAYLDSLGWAYFKQGQYTLAEENLQKALARISTDPTVHDHLGELYEKTGRLKQAAAQWELSLHEYSRSLVADAEPADVSKVQKKLDAARVKLARHESPNEGQSQR